MWWPGKARSVEVEPAPENPAPVEEVYWQRLALFTAAMAKDKSAELFQGLVEARRAPAAACAKRLSTMSSAERQAQLAVVFGAPPDESTRLRTSLAGAGPLLRAAILRRLPACDRALVADASDATPPPGLSGAAEGPPLLTALADRWVREAIR
jgi:hypothetical protein